MSLNKYRLRYPWYKSSAWRCRAWAYCRLPSRDNLELLGFIWRRARPSAFSTVRFVTSRSRATPLSPHLPEVAIHTASGKLLSLSPIGDIHDLSFGSNYRDQFHSHSNRFLRILYNILVYYIIFYELFTTQMLHLLLITFIIITQWNN